MAVTEDGECGGSLRLWSNSGVLKLGPEATGQQQPRGMVPDHGREAVYAVDGMYRRLPML